MLRSDRGLAREASSHPPITLRGVALHRGGAAAVMLSRVDGATRFVQRGFEVEIGELVVTRADRGVTVASRDGRLTLDLVEHLFAAFGGLSIHEGILVTTADDELPLLDGGARAFVAALRALEAPATSSALRVSSAAELNHGGATYRFTPGPRVEVGVEVDFRPPVGVERAAWTGDAHDFAERIAPARTFGWASEVDALRATGRARGVDLDSVLVFGEHGVVEGCEPARRDEVARHKLLDLVGDLALYGGPPLGSVHATRPGHAATHAVVAIALAQGVLAL